MKQEEPVGVSFTEPQIEVQDPFARRRQDRSVLVALGRRRIDEIAEDGEVDARVQIAEREHLEMLEQRRDGVRAREQRRHDHHRPRVVGHAFGEIEPRQPARRNRPGTESLHEGDGDVERRDDEERERDEQRRQRVVDSGQRPTAPASRPAVTATIDPR